MIAYILDPHFVPRFLIYCFALNKRIAVISDIKHAILNININAADRNFPRFLWLNSIEEENPSIVVYQFRTVTFGVGPSPFLMNANLRHHLDNMQRSLN